MELSTEQISKLLEEAKPSIIAGLRDSVIQTAKWDMQATVSKLINDEITTFMKDEIIPEIHKQLVESKEGLITVAISTASTIAEELAQSMANELKTKLQQSYTRTKIFEAMFK